MIETALKWAREHRGCGPAIVWLESEHPDATLAEAWERCPRADWMLWSLDKARLWPAYWPQIRPWLADVVERALVAAGWDDPRSRAVVAALRDDPMTVEIMDAAAVADAAAYAAAAARAAAWAGDGAPVRAADAAYASYAAAMAVVAATNWAVLVAVEDAAAYAVDVAADSDAEHQRQADELRKILGNPWK